MCLRFCVNEIAEFCECFGLPVIVYFRMWFIDSELSTDLLWEVECTCRCACCTRALLEWKYVRKVGASYQIHR